MLVGGDGLAERVAGRQVGHGVVEGRLRHADAGGGDADPAMGQCAQRVPQTVALDTAEQVLIGQCDSVKYTSAVSWPRLPSLRSGGPTRTPGRVVSTMNMDSAGRRCGRA